MVIQEIERLNVIFLLLINSITLLKNAHSLHVLLSSQRTWKGEIRERLDNLESIRLP